MGSCENSLEVEVVREPLHQTAAEQQNVCLIKVLGSEQAQLPCSEDGFDLSNGDNVRAAGVLLGCTEFYKIDNSGCVSLEGASVVDKGIGLVSENGNADSSVPGKLSEDKMVGCNLYERQSGTDDCSTQMDGLCMGKVGSSGKNFALANSPERCEQSLMEGASVDKGIGLVSDNANVVNLGPGKLSKDECGFIGGNLNERQSGIDDCSVETDQLCVEKLGSSDKNHGLMNSLQDCVMSLDLVPVSGSPENHDEQDQQKDGRSGTGPLSDCEVSAELRQMNSFPTNEFDQDKQQGSSTSLETILVVMENKSVGMSGTENDDHNQIQSLLDNESMPQLRPTTDPLGNYVQQDDQITNSPSAEGDMNEKSNISPVIEVTNCNQLVPHQGFDESLELKPLIGSPEKSVQQDEPKFDRPVCSYSHEEMMENKSDHLAVEKPTVDNQILSSVVNKTFMESDSCSGLSENCCQQNDLKTKSESTVSLGMALDGKSDVLAALDSFTCTQKSLHITDMPEELSITSLQVSICDMHDDQKKEKDVNCVTAESVPTGILKKSDLDGCIEACPPQAGSLGNYDQKNEQRDDKSISGPFAETVPDAVEEGSDVTTEIKVEICRQEFPLEGDAYDLKECSPKIALTSRLSCQSLGVSGNSSSRELEPQHLIGKDIFSAICSSNAVDCSEQTNNRGKDLAINDCPSTTGCTEIRSSSSRKSRRTPKSSQKAQTKRAAKKSRKKDKLQDLQIFKAERRKRSCFSKPARSSNWGLLGNIAQFFEQINGLGFKEIQNHEPNQNVAQGGRKWNKSRAAGSSLRSSGKRHTSTSGIRLKVKVGNEVVQNGLNIMFPEVIDTSASAGVVAIDFEAKSYPGTSFEVTKVANCVEVKMGEEGTEEQLECSGNKLGEAIIHYDASVSDFHAANKDSEGIVISQKSSGDAEADYLGVPSHVEVETLGAVIEKRYTDPGTSPDSEVINLVPEGQVNTICQEDFPDADAVLNSSKAFVTPGDVPSSKKGKKKGRVTQASDFLPEDNSPGMESLNKVKVTKNRGGRQRKGDHFCSSEILTSSTSANASSNSSNNKEFSKEQLPLSRGTELIVSRDASPEELSAETKVSSGMDVALMLSGAQNSSKLVHSTKSKGCQRLRKSGGTSKGGSKVFDGSKQRRKERKLLKKSKVKREPECKDFMNKEEADPEIDASEKSNSYDVTASMAKANLNMASIDTVEQHLHVDNAWVHCDGCHKWRRIPVALVDSIGQTNCQWICKDNMDKEFADCSIPQEKSNAEINAELGLSDADEDACDVPSKNKALELCKRTAVPKEHEFTRISTNQFLHRSRKTQTIDEIMVCHCKLPRGSGFGCGDECLNRMLNIECVRGTCPCGDLCSNQQFQKRSYAKMKWDRCGKKGFGLRLEENISKGHFLIEYVGEVLDMHTYEARQREYAFKGHKHFYFMTLNATEVIDACAKGNLGRFINHSCDPNCRTEKWVVNGEICIGLFALRDIKKGEELTFDYNYVRVFGAAAKKCYCGSPQCRGYIGGDPTSTEVIDQVDSDEEFLEPVMLEVGEAGDRIKNRASRTSSFDDVRLQVAESTSNDRDKMDNFAAAATKMEVATEIGDSMNTSTSDISQLPSSLEMGDLKESFPSSSQQADDATIESSPAVKKEIFIEETQRRLETSSATMASKSSSDVMAENRKPKSEEKRVFVKSRFLIKTSRESVCAKKGKITSNPPNVNKMMANKSQVLSSKPKKLIDCTANGRLEAVEGKLNELLDIDGGISKRKDAAKGYLKFLLLTAASGASGNGEAIQSNRDLSMILDALLKTKSRVVLIDIINKNGLRMLHNMLKQYRGDFKKTPILRKLLKVLEYLAAREILTPDHIYGGPPCPGMESFKKSMLSLTEHIDKQVHQIARSFRDRWFPRQGRKYSYMDRDDGRVEFYRGSVSNRISGSHNHLRDLAARPTEVLDGAMQPKVATASVDSPVPEGCSSLPVGAGTKTRKRKSRWDQPAEEKPSARSHQHDEQRTQFGLQQSGYNPLPDIGKKVSDHADNGRRESSGCPHCACNYHRLVEANCADLGRQKIQSDVPPGFSSPLNASSTIADLPNQNGGLMFPVGMVVGHPQRKFISRLSVSYGIPLPIMHQFGSPQDGTVESWKIAPGMPFHPFPPLPPFPHHKNESPSSSAVNSMAIDETTEGQQHRQDSATCYPNDKNPSTTIANQPDMEVSGENGQQTYKRARASSQDLGRSYFRQQKWNKKPPWMHHTNGWGHLGSNSKGGICSTTDVGSVTNEPGNSYCSQDVSSRVEKAGDCINHQSST